ncbi:MAG: RyR domain-containing protein, partial [Pseudomonadota bacterium]
VLADPDALLQERHDLIARAIHEFYLEGRLGDGEKLGARESLHEWEDLPERYRADNRMVADCYQLKLRDIGCRTIARNNHRFPVFRLRQDEEEDLARAEHDRWMVAKLADGWRYGPVRDDAARLHPDIVPFDDLSEAIKDLDREQVRVITRIVARQGRTVVRLLELALIPGDAPCPPLAPLIAALAEHYPDRLPRFTVNAKSAHAIAALTGEGVLVRGIAGDFAVPAFAFDAVTAIPVGEELAALTEHSSLCVLCGDATAPDATPVIRLNREGAIVQAPWLQ